jgi:hypothetical protein
MKISYGKQYDMKCKKNKIIILYILIIYKQL